MGKLADHRRRIRREVEREHLTARLSIEGRDAELMSISTLHTLNRMLIRIEQLEVEVERLKEGNHDRTRVTEPKAT